MARIRGKLVLGGICVAAAPAAGTAIAIADSSNTKPAPPASSGPSTVQQAKQQQAAAPTNTGTVGTKQQPPTDRTLSGSQLQKQAPTRGQRAGQARRRR